MFPIFQRIHRNYPLRVVDLKKSYYNWVNYLSYKYAHTAF